MISYQRLADDHAAIDHLVADVLAALAVPHADPMLTAQAAMCRIDTLDDALQAHLTIEDEAVYPRLIAASDRGTAEIATRFAAELPQLLADWASFRHAWTVAAAAADWSGFGACTRALLDRVRARARAETDLLYPLALQRSVIGLRTLHPA